MLASSSEPGTTRLVRGGIGRRCQDSRMTRRVALAAAVVFAGLAAGAAAAPDAASPPAREARGCAPRRGGRRHDGLPVAPCADPRRTGRRGDPDGLERPQRAAGARADGLAPSRGHRRRQSAPRDDGPGGRHRATVPLGAAERLGGRAGPPRRGRDPPTWARHGDGARAARGRRRPGAGGGRAERPRILHRGAAVAASRPCRRGPPRT